MGFVGKKEKGHGNDFLFRHSVVFVTVLILSSFFHAKADPPYYKSAPPAQATVTGTGLRIRATPSLTAPVVGQYKGGETVYILSTSPFTTTVGDKTDVWYLVLDSTGGFGWVFGGFLEIRNEGTPELALFTQWASRQETPWYEIDVKKSFPVYPSLASMDAPTKKLAIAYLVEGILRGVHGFNLLIQFGFDGEMAVPALIYQSQFVDRDPTFFGQPGEIFGDDYDGFIRDPINDYVAVLGVLTTDKAKVQALARQQRQNGLYGNPVNFPNLMALLGATDLSSDISDLKNWFLTSTVEDLDKGVYALKGALKDDPAGFAVCMRDALETKKLPQERAGALGFSLEGVDVMVGREGLVGLLKKGDEESIKRALEALKKIMPDERAMGPLLSLHNKPPFILPVLECLTVRNLPDNAVKAVMSHEKDGDGEIRHQATMALSMNVNDLSMPTLKSLLDDEDEIRWLAEDALSTFNPEGAGFVRDAWKKRILNQKRNWTQVLSFSPEGVVRSTDTIVIAFQKGRVNQNSSWELTSDRDSRGGYAHYPVPFSDLVIRKRIPSSNKETWSVLVSDIQKWLSWVFESGAGLYVIRGEGGDRIFFEYEP